jgi:hypothetical protein
LVATSAGVGACSGGPIPVAENGADSGYSADDVSPDGGSGSSGGSASSSSSGGASSCSGGASAGHDSNPDGIPYPIPSGGYGVGSVIQNLKFLGFLNNGAASQPVTTISLADYYDPCKKRYKLLHIITAGAWCQPCKAETDAFVAAKDTLASQQVAVIQALEDGPTMGVPANLGDLKSWIQNNGSNFTEVIDPCGFFNAFTNGAAVPWNADIDPRTMEILDSSDGWVGDVTTALQPGLDAIASAPGYPVPACY